MYSLAHAAPRLLTLCASLCLGLSAQAPVAKTVTNVGSFTTFLGAQNSQAWQGSNQTLQPNRSYEAKSGNWTRGQSTMAMTLDPITGFPKLYLSDFGSTSWPGTKPEPARSVHTSDSSWNPPWNIAPHSIQMQVWDVPGREVQFSCGWKVSGNGAQGAHFRVDLQSDGTWEVNQGIDGTYHSQAFRLTMPASGTITVKIETYGSASAGTGDPMDRTYAAWGQVEFGYPPQTKVTFPKYGLPCGLELDGSVTNKAVTRDIVFTLSKGTPHTLGAFFLSHAPADFPIPGTNCRLLITPPGITFPFYTDPLGKMIIHMPTISSYDAFDVFTQALLIQGTGMIHASNGLEVKGAF